ncbi:MAG: hypothetical protein ACK4UN_00890 [Limisphaerales bacterium]
MQGLLLKLTQDQTGRPGYWFLQLFRPVLSELDRFAWCFTLSPWYGAPEEFQNDELATASFKGEGDTDVMLWRPGNLSRYAYHFEEEFIDLWAIDPGCHDPATVVAEYNAAGLEQMQELCLRNAEVWLS